MEDVEDLYPVVDPRHIQLAHKLSYFAYNRQDDWSIKGRSAEVEFVFLLHCSEKENKDEAAGIVKIEGLNHIICARA